MCREPRCHVHILRFLLSVVFIHLLAKLQTCFRSQFQANQSSDSIILDSICGIIMHSYISTMIILDFLRLVGIWTILQHLWNHYFLWDPVPKAVFSWSHGILRRHGESAGINPADLGEHRPRDSKNLSPCRRARRCWQASLGGCLSLSIISNYWSLAHSLLYKLLSCAHCLSSPLLPCICLSRHHSTSWWGPCLKHLSRHEPTTYVKTWIKQKYNISFECLSIH